jgi:hypothetical protein
MTPHVKRAPAILVLLIAAVSLSATRPAEAVTYSVSTAAGLVSAVAAANANPGPDVINMAPGLYVLTEFVTPLSVTDDLTINGAARPGTVLDGTGVGGSAFSVHYSFTGDPYHPDIHATFNDLTIQNFHPGIDFMSGPGSLLTVNRTTIDKCHTAAIYTSGGPVRILNSTLSNSGDGLYVESADSLTLDNDTIADNIYNGIENYGGVLSVHNTLITGNGSDCSGHPKVADHDMDGDGTCGGGFVTVAIPLLGPLADNGGPTPTRALLTGSLAIDAGAGGEPTDQRGVSRPQGASIDIGAFEWTAMPFTSVRATLSPGGTITTDTLGTGATPAAPVQTTLSAPSGASISIAQGPGAAGFGFIGQHVQIDAAPDATPASPFTIGFVIDASVIPAGQSAATIVVDKNGTVVPPCTGSPGTASPDPCVANRQTLAGGDAQITILSSTASAWDFTPGSTLSVTDLPARLEFSVTPRPVHDEATLRFGLPVAAEVELSLFDVSGRRVARLASGHRPAGRYTITWRAAPSMPAGLYFARLRAGGEVRTATVVRAN